MTNCARLLAVAALACAAGALPAAPPREWADALSGRLAQIKSEGVVRLGYRDDAIPFSYVGPDGKPVGYTMDLCLAVVATIAEDLGGAALEIRYVRVSAQDRLERVAAGAVDLECGATTDTAERRRQVAFSPVIFVTGTRLAVPRGSKVRDVRELRGRPVAVVRGTSNEAAMRDVDRLRSLALRLVAADDYREALALVGSGKADALAADDVLLRGLLAETGRTAEFRLVGDLLSFERYGITYAKDDTGIAEVVERTLRGLAENRELAWIYNRWFMRPLPSRGTLALPMSPQLKRSFELIGLPPD